MGSLSLRNVVKRYGGFSALKGVDLEVREGEFLTLLGPSGCGKSTLLSIIAGLDQPSGGTILIDGEDVGRVLARDRDVAMIFQSYALYPNMTVRKNIMFGLKMRGVPSAEREAAAARVGEMLKITALLDRKPYQLSGGQRQRVAMGRALVRDPKLFLFDEPLSNLDAQLRAEMRVEIKRLHQKLGKTMIYVTHDQVEAMTMSSRIVVMNQGEIVQVGTPAEIYGRPAHMFVARFVGAPAMNFLPATLTRDGGGAVLAVGEEGANRPEFTVRLGDAPADVPRRVVVGVRPESITVKAPSEVVANAPSARRAVDVIEPTGADTLAIFDFAGVGVTARLGPDPGLAVGDVATFSFDTKALHIFDAQSGRRVSLLNSI